MGETMSSDTGDHGAAQPVSAPVPQRNTVGLIGLIVGIVGFVFACIPGALIVGWVLLPIAFILGIVGMFQAGKSKTTSIAAVIVSIIGVVVGVVVFATVVSDAVDDAFSSSNLEPPASTADGDPAADQPGTRENPLTIGQPVTSDDWSIQLGPPREAGAEVQAENQFNDPPGAGMQFWVVPVTATYTGESTGQPAFDISVKFVGADNRTYDDSCGVIPSPLADVGELYAGGVAEGNVCVAVPAGADGLWTLTAGLLGKPMFFTAQ
ncbi:hypothetical protein [Mycolicibacterium sp.]|uniref:hypothetical protein n=1 Tax=Mycolicibacterium sp. TaxID=2320850 RepID=UPI00355F6E88